MSAQHSILVTTGILVFLSWRLVLPSTGEPLTYLGCYLRERSVSFGDPGTAEPVPVYAPSSSVLDLWFTPRAGSASGGPQNCVSACRSNSFRYAGIHKHYGTLDCLCGSSYGRNGIGDCDNCTEVITQHCGSETAASIYDTGFKVPSAPQQVMLLQKTENSLRVSWVKPLATNGPLTGYHITATGMFSYSHSSSVLQPKMWKTSDLEQELSLGGLSPGTQYQVSVAAANSDGDSLPTTVTMWTKVGVPDPPPPPKVIRQDKQTMTIEFKSVRNTKGPISAYRVSMIDESQPGFFNKDRAATWNDSMIIGYRHYVAAEFSTDEIPHSGYRKFVIGDRRTYRGFYNGPIPTEGHWHPALGLVSTMDEFTELSYSPTSHDQHAEADSHKEEVEDVVFGRARPKKELDQEQRVEIISENSALVTALWIAIAVSILILLVCVLAYTVLKTNVFPKRRPSAAQPPVERRVENHQLATREPSYIFPEDPTGGYTHAGFLPDEDVKSRCLDKLKQIWYVPRNFMDIPADDEDSVELVGKGRYGPVYHSSLKTNGSPVTLYAVPASNFKDSSGNRAKPNMMQEDPEKLFAHLDELVRIEPHENVVKLIGFLEDGDSMLFALEYVGISLKSWLLQYRRFDGTTIGSPVTPYSFLLCAMNIAEALYHLHSFRITHGELAACNVLVTSNIEVPKVTGFGLLSNNPLNEQKDYTRWSAVEQFQNRCVKPCDMWSFGVLLWELATMGGTPYNDIRSEDLQKRVCRGTRPNQVEVMSDPLYQIMLHCWQLDRDERPDFGALSCSIHELLPHSKDNLFISPSFNYPPYTHNYEHIK